MAAIGGTNPTLLDMVSRTDPDGNIAEVVEALSKRNPVLMDATAQEGNLPTGHRVTIRSGLPTVGWRMLNEGIVPSKSTTIQVDETCGLLEGRCEVDCELARLNGNEAAFRNSEERGFVQALGIEATDALMYASTKTAPEEIHGWTPRYNSLSAENAENIVDFNDYSGQTGDGADQRSIWFITWGPDTAYMIYPKGTVGGLTSEDLGKEYVEDRDGTANKKFLAWRTHWCWRLGLCIKDWRYHVRIANIDAGDAAAAAGADSDSLIMSMVDAYNRIYELNAGRTVIYTCRQVINWLDQQIMKKSNVWFAPMEWHGHPVNSFRGIPILPTDALDFDEAKVV